METFANNYRMTNKMLSHSGDWKSEEMSPSMRSTNTPLEFKKKKYGASDKKKTCPKRYM